MIVSDCLDAAILWPYKTFTCNACGMGAVRQRTCSRRLMVDPATILAVSAGTKVLGDLIGTWTKEKTRGLVSQLIETNREVPLIVGEDKTLRIQSPDNRISWGVARRDSKYRVVILTEKENSRSHSLAENIAKSNPGLAETQVIGRAQSSRPFDRAKQPLQPPLFPGSSIGHIQGYPGTLGCVVRRKTAKQSWIGVTSASHVLSITNTGKKGDPIIAPGHPDGSKSLDNRCGSLADFIYLTHYSKAPSSNFLCVSDVALVQVDEDYESGELPDRNWVIDPETGKQMPIVGLVEGLEARLDRSGQKVFKVGRTTGLTAGTLDIVGLQRQAIQLPDGQIYHYNDMMTVQAEKSSFSESGDSGALVYTADGQAIGFVVGGSGSTTWVSPADQCLRDIKSELVR